MSNDTSIPVIHVPASFGEVGIDNFMPNNSCGCTAMSNEDVHLLIERLKKGEWINRQLDTQCLCEPITIEREERLIEILRNRPERPEISTNNGACGCNAMTINEVDAFIQKIKQ